MDTEGSAQAANDRRSICCCGRSECPTIAAAFATLDHPMNGSYHYKTGTSPKKLAFQRVLIRNICPPFTAELTRTEYEIPLFHWTEDALRYFAGDRRCPVSDGKEHYPSSPVGADIAKRYGFDDACNEYKGGYFWPPMHKMEDALFLRDQLLGKLSRGRKRRNTSTDATGSTATPVVATKRAKATVTPCDGDAELSAALGDEEEEVDSPLTAMAWKPILVYDVCKQGIGHPRIDEAAKSGGSGLRACAEYFFCTPHDGRWRSKNCFVYGEAETLVPADRCASCLSVYNKIGPDRYELLYRNGADGDVALVASVTELESVLIRGYGMKGESYLRSNQVRTIASLLVDYHGCRQPVKLAGNTWLNLCPSFPGAVCSRYSTSKLLLRSQSFCDSCQSKKEADAKRQRRKEENREKQVAASSKTPISLLTPERYKERMANKKKVVRSTKDKLRYAKKKLNDPSLQILLDRRVENKFIIGVVYF
jgi:hypothetical protein